MLRRASSRTGPVNDAPERIDVATRVPKTKEECEHFARYEWASAQVRGEVLDVASGTGYGAKLLVRHARVCGVDRDEEAVETARSRVAGTFVVVEAIEFHGASTVLPGSSQPAFARRHAHC
jgi:protein-L-isoaspartate O-methyltransferase